MSISREVIDLLDKWEPAAFGLLGVVVGAGLTAWFAKRRSREERRHAFVEKQLTELYSPMLGLRAEVQTLSEVRVKIQAEADAAWHDLCDAVEDADAKAQLIEARFPQFQALIEHDNKKLIERLLPAYRRMAEILRDKLWLCEESTRRHYPALLGFLDVWDRWLDKSLPVEVLEQLDHTEDNLKALYSDLQTQHDRLRELLARGEA